MDSAGPQPEAVIWFPGDDLFAPTLRRRVEPCCLDEGQRTWVSPPDPMLAALHARAGRPA